VGLVEIEARRIEHGLPEWKLAGLPVARTAAGR